MIEPVLADDALLEDIRSARQRADSLTVWWLGQSGFLVHWQGCHVLLDPYLSDSLTRKYAATDKPHVRMTRRVISPERLDFVQVVSSSHNHTDHLDGETLRPLMDGNPNLEILVPEANRAFAAERLGVVPERLATIDAGQSREFGKVRFHAVPAAHESLEQDELGRHRYLGYVVEFGPYTVYHSGDTVLYEGMAETLQRWNIDLALLPINGRGPERRVAGNLWGREAAWLAHEVGARVVVPCHYEMFTFNTASPDEFVQEATRLGQPYQVLRAGERLELADSRSEAFPRSS